MKTSDKIKNISVLIPDGEPWDVVKVLRCFSEIKGIRTYVMSRTRLPSSRLSRYCSGFYYNKSKNEEEWICEIKRLIGKIKIDVVMPVTLKGIKQVSRNRKSIEEYASVPPIAETEQIEMTDNKWEFHKNITKMGLPVLPTVFVGKAGEEIDESLNINLIEFPALLKPTSQNGGNGIIKVEKSSGFEYAWRNGQVIKDQQYILQKYVESKRFSLSVCCQNGEIISYTLQSVLIPSKNPYQPGKALEYVYNEKVLDISKKMFKALKWNGIANVDLLFDEHNQEIYILDFNPRLWRSILGSLIAGVNIPYIWCLSALGINEPSNQSKDVKYTRPATFIKMMMSKLIGRRCPMKMRWKECDLKYTVNDPLPELFNVVQKAINRFRHKLLN
jgi:glutathione synthase/RimK-type ligase-like ATP-grasp enzyme